ncbi:MAG TPA: T9SS type A sorting domain-containing protein, partial [Flavobacteriales bacterium]|nr:T9SS type A sorting domain-containing protein [Flavobacteriales bacterium]
TNACAGGNTFNGDVDIRNSGSGALYLASTDADLFNGNATFVVSAAGELVIAQGSDVHFRKNVTTNGDVAFGPAVPGTMRIVFDGHSQQLFTSDAAYTTRIHNLTVATTGEGALDLLSTVHVTGDIAFASGFIRPRATTSADNGLLILENGITSSQPAHATSYVEGYVRKVGDEAFIFPVGYGGVFAPIAISAPASASDHFTASYDRQDPSVPSGDPEHDASLDQVSTCENWILDRTNGSSAVTVTLSYDASRSCGVTDASRLSVAGWDGSMWMDHGGAALGTSALGTVMSAAPINDYTEFTLALSMLRERDPLHPVSNTPEEAVPATGIDEHAAEAPDASVFPNPTTGEAMVVLHGLEQGPVSITVLDMGGSQVREASRMARSSNLVAPISLDGLPAGMYLVRALQANGRPLEVRVIKQ